MKIPVFAALAALGSSLFAQESAVTVPPLADAPIKSAQGLALTFSAGGKSDTRPARLVALYVPAGQPVTPFLAPGPFTAKWEGAINSPLRSEYTFAAEVKGSFKLTINDKLILEGAGDDASQSMNKAFQLSKGANTIVAEFASDGKSDAMVRLNWWASDFPAEPVPPTVFTHDANAKALREGVRVRDGRLLFAELRCAACHGDATLIPPRGSGMPELAHDAPLFDDLGSKFNETWLAHWINDPHAIRPRSLMPRVFAGKAGEVDQRAADLAAYFASTGKRDDTAPAAENAPLGGALFANFGCIACHTTPDFSGADEYGRVPLGHLKAKWQPRALTAFLKDPAKSYVWTHMPNFRLTEEEAERLTAYLISGEQRDFPAGPKGDATRGAQLLATTGCLNCHAGLPPTTQPTLAATLKGGWTKGCMSTDAAARGDAPDFALTPHQREALLAFAATGFGSLKQDTPIEFAERQVHNNRCAACHASDGVVSVWANLEGEMSPLTAAAPVLPEGDEHAPVPGATAPMMTWLGEKLWPDYMTAVIAGKHPAKPRPWIIGRMPGFVAVAEGISTGLSLSHGFAPAVDQEPAPDPQKAQHGLTLLGAEGGFNCITCHGIGEQAPTAVFEAPGINLALSMERLRKGYFDRWVLHPLRIDPETKMPRFADDEGKTPLTDILDGDARQQIDAMWQHLRTVKK